MFNTLSHKEEEIKHTIQHHFTAFFEGIRDIGPQGERNFIVPPIEAIEISKFGIQKIETKIDDKIKLIVHLLRPGIFIGKKASLIYKLQDYLSTNLGRQVTIDVKEVIPDIWGFKEDKKYLPKDEVIKLYTKAKAASEKTYSLYSNFPVSAAVLTKNGKIFTGVNIENASYSITLCAERVAFSNAIAAGHKDIKAIAIYASVNSIPPCGACRQFMIEFGEDIIVIFKYNGEIIQKLVSEILPYKFSF